ncbi:hypothetical protein BDR04DRAFT_1131202 [Suillus decipiens]|nr:hypothetical protein BDR04DRAFT_1131202 [Suillus decipiens]
MTAVLCPSFYESAVQFPTADEKELAKSWVEAHSCHAWRNGWGLSNYLLNVQIVSLPNLRIIDFSYGHTGSTHNVSAWQETFIAQNHDDILKDGEFIWADSTYPVRVFIH